MSGLASFTAWNDDSSVNVRCAHEFVQFQRWPVKDRWRCRLCAFETRRYDVIDQQMMRPIHRHMSVAMKGVNTVSVEKPAKCVSVVGRLFGHKFLKRAGGRIYDWEWCFRCGMPIGGWKKT